ncbi:MAG TPA: TetR/AcrR family transcriptional regulator [Anaerolineales bacterium]
MTARITTKGEASRQAILKAAYEVFLEKGYHGASVRDISRRCGLTIGGVYTHFADKDAIFVAVLKAYHPFLQVLPALGAARGDTPDALIRDMARRMLAALGSQREALNLIFIEIVEFQGRHFEALIPQYFPQLVEHFKPLVELGEELRPVPLPVLARAFFGLFFSFFLTNVALSAQLPTDEGTLDTFVDIYLHGILSDIPSNHPISSFSPSEQNPGEQEP